MTKKHFPSSVEILDSVKKLTVPPTSEDMLFSEKENSTKEDRRNMAYLKHGDWSVYIWGYKDAADILVNHVENGTGHDLLVYPIMFLYRQCFEVAIKGLIIKAENQLEIPHSVNNIHNLDVLWKTCEGHLLIIFPDLTDGERKALKQVTRLIKEFCMVDLQSDGFRFPTDTKGNPSLSSIKQIPLTRIRDVVEKIYNVLNNRYLCLVNMQDQDIESDNNLNDFEFLTNMD